MAKKKPKIVFFCKECGYESPQWFGKCPSCSAWNTLAQKQVEPQNDRPHSHGHLTSFSSNLLKLKDAPVDDWQRYKTGISEFDIIVGGGLASGSLVLLGGAPGIGKSTLMLAVCDKLSKYGNVLYASGEESAAQIKARAIRLKVNHDNIYLLSETNLNNIVEAIEKVKPLFIVIDSVQTVYHPDIAGGPGTVSQIKEVAAKLLSIAKSTNTVVFLLGHVTKGGDLAGPRVLEHIVDTVLYFENEAKQLFRLLRVYKNRFGPTNEIGVFEMCQDGLKEVKDVSEIFLSERTISAPGAIATASVEGTRTLLLEVQTLCVRTNFAIAKRTVAGYDVNRVALLIAVLQKRLGLPLDSYDVFANIAGGIRVRETAVDLAFALALVSANNNFICPKDLVVFGEVGLAGEIRSVGFAKERLQEAAKAGFKRAIIPKSNMKKIGAIDIEIRPAQTIEEAAYFLEK